jgi:hypothetical protein
VTARWNGDVKVSPTPRAAPSASSTLTISALLTRGDLGRRARATCFTASGTHLAMRVPQPFRANADPCTAARAAIFIDCQKSSGPSEVAVHGITSGRSIEPHGWSKRKQQIVQARTAAHASLFVDALEVAPALARDSAISSLRAPPSRGRTIARITPATAIRQSQARTRWTDSRVHTCFRSECRVM